MYAGLAAIAPGGEKGGDVATRGGQGRDPVLVAPGAHRRAVGGAGVRRFRTAAIGVGQFVAAARLPSFSGFSATPRMSNQLLTATGAPPTGGSAASLPGRPPPQARDQCRQVVGHGIGTLGGVAGHGSHRGVAPALLRGPGRLVVRSAAARPGLAARKVPLRPRSSPAYWSDTPFPGPPEVFRVAGHL